MKIPNSEQVSVAWLNSLPVLDAPAASSLPVKADTWSASGFVVAEIVGTAHLADVPERAPIVRCHAWAVKPGSSSAPYGHASGMAEIIRDAAWYWTRPLRLDMPAGFAPVIVTRAWPVSELQRIPDPDASRAHYVTDIGLAWVPVTTE